MPIQLQPTGIQLGPGPDQPTGDLITLGYALAGLAAGNQLIQAAQQAIVPKLIKTASRVIRKHCNRFFNRTILDGLYTIDQPGATLLLREFPVNRILRLCTNPSPVLTVSNSNKTANQRATAELVVNGGTDYPDQPPVATGLSLVRIASGATIPAAVPFTNEMTIAQLGAAVVALGNGWTATVDDEFGDWPVSDLRCVQGATPALGANAANLLIHVDDLPFTLDADIGEIEITDSSVDPFSSIRFGPYLSTSVDDLTVYGGRNGIRCIYDAGWDVVPEDVQQACVETVIDMMLQLRRDPRLGSENLGAYSYVLNTAFADYALTRPALGKLSPYVNHRA